MHPWHDLPPGDAAPEVVEVVVEIPRGSKNKVEIDKRTGAFRLDRVLYTAVAYPGDYGFVPQTWYDDGDPLDVLVLTNHPTFTGCVVEARPLGLFRMRDRGQPDDKVLAALHRDPSLDGLRSLDDVAPHVLREVEHFFRVYKDLEGGRVETLGWEPASSARERVAYGIAQYASRRTTLRG